MRNSRIIAAAAITAGLAAGCSSDEPAAGCLDATTAGEAIAAGASDQPITPVQAQAVQLDGSEVYYVAMSFTVADEDVSGVWATTELEGGSIISVDAVAKSFTDWPDAADAFDITYPNDGTRAAEACLD